MDRVSFYGSIKTGDRQIVARLLGDWVKSRELDVRIRLSGVEIVYEDEAVYLYCYEAAIDPGQKPFYLLEGNMAGTLDDANARLSQLLQSCKERGIACTLDYVLVNENGDQVGEELSLTW